jgi:2,4-dienoyl-CoA reductase-like NADH-dependent reductase (Old Yellow Enzyme family)
MNDRHIPYSHDKKTAIAGYSRRHVLKIAGLMAAGLGVTTVSGLTGCGPVMTDGNCLDEIFSGPATTSRKPFERSSLGGITLNNRIIRSAVTMNGYDSQGRPTSYLLDHYRDLARGGTGAIITGMRDSGMMVDDFLYRDEFFSDYRKVPDIAHRYNTPIIQQLSHHGQQVSLTFKRKDFVNRLSENDITGIIDLFVRGALLSRDLGFDGVQLHAAHGYLLSDFLSPARNRREDRWGGSEENRFRIIGEIHKGITKKAPGLPLLIKINAYDHQRGGMRVEDAAGVAARLERTGFAAIEVSCGTADDGFNTVRVPEIPGEALVAFSDYKKLPSPLRAMVPAMAPLVARRFEPLDNFNVCAARVISRSVDIPVIVVGGIRNIADINAILASGAATHVSMGRPFIIEPDIVNRFKKEPLARSECINCGYCLMAANDASEKVRCFYGQL